MSGSITIQTAARLSGVLPDTIRAWEKRYKALSPDRDSSGSRQYSRNDVQKLWYLKALTEEGFKISRIAGKTLQELEGEYRYLYPEQGAQNSPPPIKENEFAQDASLERIRTSISNYSLDLLSHEIRKASYSLEPKRFALDIVAPTLRYIGEFVSTGKLDIAQEHAASAIIKFHIGRILGNVEYRKLKSTKTLIFATPENEHHEFGILISALAAANSGHNIYYLGPNLPYRSLIAAAKALKATDVVVAASAIKSKSSLANYLSNCLDALPKKTRICYGGLALPKNNLLLSANKRLKVFKDLESFCDYLSR